MGCDAGFGGGEVCAFFGLADDQAVGADECGVEGDDAAGVLGGGGGELGEEVCGEGCVELVVW